MQSKNAIQKKKEKEKKSSSVKDTAMFANQKNI